MCQANTCERVRARARVQVLQNSGSQMVVLSLQRCQREIATDEIQEKKIQSVKKRACQCTDGLSAAQNGQGAAERLALITVIRNRTLVD